ncbi:SDR family oxidoreductase [Ruegeria sp.]|uniref:SDR family NAD(P)-dependent oxidoreductase n=1 Tax=Ruegeria sp. TaxID=1879320 RepID=UPI002318AAC4|nr:SDR family oxidoreductase [Ruegeria sp.]MDA7966505.1 SDR family oxidoreductase [Ruegeria sp.]
MFHGKTALVTGATSGIGAATALSLAAAGARVALQGRSTERGEKLRQQLEGQGHLFLPGDLRKAETANQAVATALETFGRLDIVVNSLGVAPHGKVADTTDAVWDSAMITNVNAVFYICRAAIPAMISAGGGCIVNVASTLGMVAAPSSVAYCASKGALIQLTRAMAIDHAHQNVRINAICPGAVDTPMVAAEAQDLGVSEQELKGIWAEEAPNKRLASAQDVADAVVFMASDKAAHFHGTALPLDGGVTAM